MSPNNKIGAKCLNNLHLKLNDNGILPDANKQVDVDNYDKEEEAQKNEEEREEKEEEVLEKEDQELVPSGIAERVVQKENRGKKQVRGKLKNKVRMWRRTLMIMMIVMRRFNCRVRSSLLQHRGKVEG